MFNSSYEVNHSSNAQIDADKLENYFLDLVKKFGLNDLWKKEDFFKTEVKKSIIRGLLRNSNFSKSILSHLIKNFKDSKFYKKDIIWCTNIYPMIHLAEDRSEAVGYHYDKIGNSEFYTSWLPITNYDYPALSYIKLSHLFHPIISRILIKLKLTKFFSKYINVKKGDIFLGPLSFKVIAPL